MGEKKKEKDGFTHGQHSKRSLNETEEWLTLMSTKLPMPFLRLRRFSAARDREMSLYLAKQVELYLLEICHNQIPTVEQIQDAR